MDPDCPAEEPRTSVVEPSFILAQMRALLPPDGGAARDDGEMVDAACVVWDLSTNAEVAAFMCEHGVVPLVLRLVCARHEHSSRLLETCLGTLANLAADLAVCDAIAARDVWSVLCEVLLGSTDSSVLLELMRAFSTALSTLSVSRPRYLRQWLAELRAPAPLAQLLRVLANTRRREVLLAGLTLLSTASYASEELAAQCAAGADPNRTQPHRMHPLEGAAAEDEAAPPLNRHLDGQSHGQSHGQLTACQPAEPPARAPSGVARQSCPSLAADLLGAGGLPAVADLLVEHGTGLTAVPNTQHTRAGDGGGSARGVWFQQHHIRPRRWCLRWRLRPRGC